MQVDPVPASPAVLPETPVSAVPTVSSQPSEEPTPSLPEPEEGEQPTFHVMQPPAPTPVQPAEPTATPSSTSYAQLIAVPIASDQPPVTDVPTTTATPIPVPTSASATMSTTTATPTTAKQTKRGSRSSHTKPIHRSPAKPATLLARPSTGKPSTILPQPQKAVLLGNQMTPLVPKPITTNGQVTKPATNNTAAGFTTYLVVDGNQGQLVQVANDGQKPITFRNQAGQILQATPITVVATGNQPAAPTFQSNGDSTLVTNVPQVNPFYQQHQQQQPQQQQMAVTSLVAQQSHQNTSQTMTTVRTNSSIDMPRTTLTNDTTTLTTQQVSGLTHIPSTPSLLNGCNLMTHQPSLLQPNPTIMTSSIFNGSITHSHERDASPGHHDNDSSLDETSGLDASGTQDPNGSLSQLARKGNHRQRRSSSSSLSKKKRGRPRLYERDPFTNKPIKSRPPPEGTELTLPHMTTTTTTLLMPGPATTTTFNNLHSHSHPHSNGCASLIFPNQSINHTTTTTSLPTANPSLLQQQTYSYPSLLNGNAPSANMLSAPTLNIFSNTGNHSNVGPNYSYTPSPTTILPPPSLPIASTPTLSRPLMPPITHTVENQATIPLKNLQISSTSSPMTSSPRPSSTSNTNGHTTVPNMVQLNPSPIKTFNQTSNNNDVVVHYIGGFVIRESSHPFPTDDHRDDDRDDHMKDLNLSNGKEKENTSFNDNQSDLGSDQLRCLSCKKVDFSERFYNQEKKLCSRTCATKPAKSTKLINGKKCHHEKTPPVHEPTRVIENPPSIQPPVESHIEEETPLAPDHGLPNDPSKWTVYQVGEFVARLTNETIREAFYESEMDGQALLLMTQEHLRDTMKIKLGPSLIIASEITKLRERARAFPS